MAIPNSMSTALRDLASQTSLAGNVATAALTKQAAPDPLAALFAATDDDITTATLLTDVLDPARSDDLWHLAAVFAATEPFTTELDVRIALTALAMNPTPGPALAPNQPARPILDRFLPTSSASRTDVERFLARSDDYVNAPTLAGAFIRGWNATPDGIDLVGDDAGLVSMAIASGTVADLSVWGIEAKRHDRILQAWMTLAPAHAAAAIKDCEQRDAGGETVLAALAAFLNVPHLHDPCLLPTDANFTGKGLLDLYRRPPTVNPEPAVVAHVLDENNAADFVDVVTETLTTGTLNPTLVPDTTPEDATLTMDCDEHRYALSVARSSRNTELIGGLSDPARWPTPDPATVAALVLTARTLAHCRAAWEHHEPPKTSMALNRRDSLAKALGAIADDAARGPAELPLPAPAPAVVAAAKHLATTALADGLSRRQLLIQLVDVLQPVTVAELFDVLTHAGDDVLMTSVHATCSQLATASLLTRNDDGTLSAARSS